MGENKEDKKNYKAIVIVGTGILLYWVLSTLHDKIDEYSKVLAYFVGLFFMYLFYRIMKALFPGLW